MDTLDDYDPLTEAIAFDDSPVSILMEGDETVTLNNQTFTLSKGLTEVPLFLALFLIGKKMANIATKQH